MAFLNKCNLPGLLMLFLCASISAQAGEALLLSEDKIKAGLVYNFLRYTQWPSNPTAESPLTVCILGDDPFSGRLLPMGGRTVKLQTIVIHAIEEEDSIQHCYMIIIHPDKKDFWPQLRQKLGVLPVLTVSDFQDFALQGGMIELANIQNRIEVHINVEAVNATGLQIDDSLLKLATVVSSSPDRTER